MWPMGVVVVDVDAQDALELPSAGDQEPVEAVAADGADPAFGERVCLWRLKWGGDDLDAFAAKDIVEVATELAVAVLDQEAGPCRSPESDQASCRACSAVQRPSGFAVQPRGARAGCRVRGRRAHRADQARASRP
jgi:hypothetical protein